MVCFTIEELNDISEVHVVLQDDVPVDLHQCQGNKEDKVTRGDILGGPYGFPDCKHVLIHQLWKIMNKKEGYILRKLDEKVKRKWKYTMSLRLNPLVYSKVNLCNRSSCQLLRRVFQKYN